MKQRVYSYSEIFARIFAAVFMITIVIYFRSWSKEETAPFFQNFYSR